jgi:hypothetical protein
MIMIERACQYSPSVTCLRIGNFDENNEEAPVSSEPRAASANSILTLKDKIMRLDDMVLVEGDESESPPTDDEESLA